MLRLHSCDYKSQEFRRDDLISVEIVQNELVVGRAALRTVDDDDRSNLAGRESVGNVQSRNHVLRTRLRDNYVVVPGSYGDVSTCIRVGEVELGIQPSDPRT